MFGAIFDGIYGAKITKEVAKELGVPINSIPKWVKNFSQEVAITSRSNGRAPEDVAKSVVSRYGEQIMKEIQNK